MNALHPRRPDSSAALRSGRVRPLGERLRDESGIVVLGPLIVITVLVLVFGFLGYLKQRDPYRVSLAGREQRIALAPLEVQYGSVVVERVPEGTSLWVYPLRSGQVAVFRSEDSPNVVGFAPDSLLRTAVR